MSEVGCTLRFMKSSLTVITIAMCACEPAFPGPQYARPGCHWTACMNHLDGNGLRCSVLVDDREIARFPDGEAAIGFIKSHDLMMCRTP